ncbi:MAG: hypothetical protein FJX72_02290 [Armatimonadetes bacterium]|nr:hypothetical protein [Armatimonadota bacterium]
MVSDLDAAEQACQHSSHNRDEVLASDTCACYHCLRTFVPSDLTDDDWADEAGAPSSTALCPFCGIDAVLGSTSGIELEPAALQRLREHWFGPKPQQA